MSRHQGQLPREIFTRIFCQLDTVDLFVCLSVCRSWYFSAKPYCYQHVQFNRLASIEEFITNMQSAPHQPNLRVKKISFTCKDSQSRMISEPNAFARRFLQLITLCPNIEIITSSEKVATNVVRALDRLPSPLKNLNAFPFSSDTDAYSRCANRHRLTLREYTVPRRYYQDFCGIDPSTFRNFPQLQKLFMTETALQDIQDVERILRENIHLEQLAVKVYDRRANNDYIIADNEDSISLNQSDIPDDDYAVHQAAYAISDEHNSYNTDSDDIDDDFTIYEDDLNFLDDQFNLIDNQYNMPFEEHDISDDEHVVIAEEPDNIEEEPNYPKIKRLTFHSADRVLDLTPFISFISKFNHLQLLDLEAVDILTTENPNHQYEELKILLDMIGTLPSASFAIKSANIARFRSLALQYLQLFFRPEYSKKPNRLKFKHYTNRCYSQSDALLYTRNNIKDYSLELTFSIAYYPSAYDSYIEIFAPYVKALEINYDFQPCESLLDTVFAKCNALNSLTVTYSDCSRDLPSIFNLDDSNPWRSTINTSLHTIVLRSCIIRPKFLSSLTYACQNLLQLTIDDARNTDLDHIKMPKTELEQLDLDLDLLSRKSFGRESLALITLEDNYKTMYFYTDFKKKEYMVPGEEPKQYTGCKVILSFKKIERLRVYFMLDDFQRTMELSTL